jgi:XTP/dITP diphosphohydrolase
MLVITLATSNRGKAKEFARLFGAGYSVRALAPHITLPVETGDTFAANARLKAESVFASLGGTKAVLADDSGLEVGALGGLPGVRSARYAGPEAGDEENVALLIAELEGQTDRRARFVCELALVLPGEGKGFGPRLVTARGELRGRISECRRGDGGFGYDPVFVPDGWERTLAEVEAGEKDRVSHRGAAVQALLRELHTQVGGELAHGRGKG